MRSAPTSRLATLDLTDEKQRFICESIQRMHSGRWPLFRMLGMKQIGGVIFEAAEWVRRNKHQKPSFCVIRWSPDTLGLSWKTATSANAALAMLADPAPYFRRA